MTPLTEFRLSVHRLAVMGAVFLSALAAVPHRALCGDAEVRRPVWAGSFYPGEASVLVTLIDRLVDAAPPSPGLPPTETLRALILPHAGYAYSGPTAAYGARLLRGQHRRTVIVMGPDHRVGFDDNAVSAVDAYETPLGRIPLSPKAAALRNLHGRFRPVPASDAGEHSVEVVLPFLQRTLDSFELVPVVMGPGDPMGNAEAVEPLLDADTLLVVSSDLSHFLPYEAAQSTDTRTVRAILDLDSAYLAKGQNLACGVIPILTLMEIARRLAWQPVLLHYANSGDTAGDRQRVVGYSAIAFFGDPTMQAPPRDQNRLSESQGHLLTALARRTITQALGQPLPSKPSESELAQALSDPVLQGRCGTFVTLKIDNRLRGCIGSLDTRTTIVDGVRRNAVQAAFHDPRFKPLRAEELARTDIEVSVLTEPRPLPYSDAADLLAKLRVNVDGVIIRRGPAGATFLPQVWEQLPRPEEFLSHLCLKAGLSADAWRTGDLDVETYQVQYFEEQK